MYFKMQFKHFYVRNCHMSFTLTLVKHLKKLSIPFTKNQFIPLFKKVGKGTKIRLPQTNLPILVYLIFKP